MQEFAQISAPWEIINSSGLVSDNVGILNTEFITLQLRKYEAKVSGGFLLKAMKSLCSVFSLCVSKFSLYKNKWITLMR